MIRAGRLKHVRTSDDLAGKLGIAVGTFRNQKPHQAAGHPPPISSPSARVLLWDGEETDAYYAEDKAALARVLRRSRRGEDGKDLLDRHEAAAEIGVEPKTWDSYKRQPPIAGHAVDVRGVEHWPRHVVRLLHDRPGKSAATGRPKDSGDRVPRDLVGRRVAELLDDDPAVTLSAVIDALGVGYSTAQRHLAQVRGRRIADLLQTEPELGPEQAAKQLGYPVAVHRGAIAAAATELRGREAHSYLQQVADALAENGLAEPATVEVQQLPDDVLAAVCLLRPGGTAPALVWDERYGWRTATSRRHPIGKDPSTAPAGEGIRYLGAGRTPEPGEVLADLTDRRKGSRRPRPGSVAARES